MAKKETAKTKEQEPGYTHIKVRSITGRPHRRAGLIFSPVAIRLALKELEGWQLDAICNDRLLSVEQL